MKTDLEIGDRVRIRTGRPWSNEIGTYVGTENTLVGLMYKITLDTGFSTLQKRHGFHKVRK
jgi:hypothetical protein